MLAPAVLFSIGCAGFVAVVTVQSQACLRHTSCERRFRAWAIILVDLISGKGVALSHCIAAAAERAAKELGARDMAGESRRE
jgi:hypothetical protein